MRIDDEIFGNTQVMTAICVELCHKYNIDYDSDRFATGVGQFIDSCELCLKCYDTINCEEVFRMTFKEEAKNYEFDKTIKEILMEE